MENQYPISLIDLIILNIYLGSIIFILGTILLFFLIKRRNKLKISFLATVAQLGGSIFLSLLIWKLWPFKTDIMYSFIFYPALLTSGIPTNQIFSIDESSYKSH